MLLEVKINVHAAELFFQPHKKKKAIIFSDIMRAALFQAGHGDSTVSRCWMPCVFQSIIIHCLSRKGQFLGKQVYKNKHTHKII